MHKWMILTKRNCLVFLRDRTAVFFSLLSMLIILILMGIFLNGMNVETVEELLKTYGGIRDSTVDHANATYLVQYWTLAGLLVVNAVTVTLAVIGIMIEDVNEHRLAMFYTAPVSKNIIALSYITAATIIGTFFDCITLIVSVAFITASGGQMLSLLQIIKIIGYIVMNVSVFAMIMYFVAIFIKSSSAWSGFATIVGTLVGFVGAIYLPVGSLPDNIVRVLSYFPVLHGTSLMRKVCCINSLQQTFQDTPTELLTKYQEEMGITVQLQGKVVNDHFQIIFVLTCGMIALMICVMTQYKKQQCER